MTKMTRELEAAIGIQWVELADAEKQKAKLPKTVKKPLIVKSRYVDAELRRKRIMEAYSVQKVWHYAELARSLSLEAKRTNNDVNTLRRDGLLKRHEVDVGVYVLVEPADG